VRERPEAAQRSADARIADRVAQAVRQGHPWVFREALSGRVDAPSGAELRVVDAAGRFVARGLFEADSPIAFRAWTRDDRPVDSGLFRERIASAFALRDRLFGGGDTTAFRLLHGEGDRAPGVVVDRYEGVAVLRLDGAAVEARMSELVDAMWPALASRGVEVLVRKQRGSALETLRGGSAPGRVAVREHGMRFWVDLAEGQKTGAFLDQRDNRARVRSLSSGRRVLNLFSYAGGFSLAAALGGAREVTSVDIAAAAHKTAQESFRLAGIDPRPHRFVTADAFAWLASAEARSERFDLIVSDPPSFAPNERSVPRALRSYRELHRACARLLAPEGVFCAASCSSHVDAERFLSTLGDDALGEPALRVLELHGPPPDHPSIAAFPEGRYLKFVVLG
jgi:23S rRNA (cytosine1962-C5)-methyltransferase